MAKTKHFDLNCVERPNEAVRMAVQTYLADLPLHMRADNDNAGIREDAGETALVAAALTQTAIEAIETIYPETKFREVAPPQLGIDEGANTYEWQEYDQTGMAEIISNGSDELPNISQFVRTNTGKVESYGIAYSFTDQDIRAAAFARRTGRSAIVLGPDKAIAAREGAERRKDYDGAFGNVKFAIPGFFRNANVTLGISPAPAAGTVRSWRGGDKTGREVLAELRAGLRQVTVTTKGNQTATHIVMSVEMHAWLSSMPLLPTNDNQTTVLAEFLRSQKEMEQPVTIIKWNRALTADVAGTGDRVVFYRRAPDVLGYVEPMILRALPPERRGMATHVANETRFGGIIIKRPISVYYYDFVP